MCPPVSIRHYEYVHSSTFLILSMSHSAWGGVQGIKLIDSLLEECDILCLQETFLPVQELEKFKFLTQKWGNQRPISAQQY